jgi:hypothetical protein
MSTIWIFSRLGSPRDATAVLERRMRSRDPVVFLVDRRQHALDDGRSSRTYRTDRNAP